MDGKMVGETYGGRVDDHFIGLLSVWVSVIQMYDTAKLLRSGATRPRKSKGSGSPPAHFMILVKHPLHKDSEKSHVAHSRS